MFQGFKTKYDKILPVLDQTYVGERLIREFINKKEVCFVGRRHAFISKLSHFLPTPAYDWITINENISDFSNNVNNPALKKK